MKTRTTFLILLALMHLVLVVCGAARFKLASGQSLAGFLLGHYGTLSGSDTTYGFFAPNVAPQITATFTLSDKNARTWVVSPEDLGVTSEADLRFESSINMTTFEQFRESIPASWAAALLGRYPEAVKVEVLVQSQLLPTMEYFRAGYKPRWEVVFRGSFSRREARPLETFALVR